jgi:hypothetical protein
MRGASFPGKPWAKRGHRDTRLETQEITVEDISDYRKYGRFLIFEIKDAGAIFANNDLFAKTDLIDKLWPQLHLASRTNLAIHQS